MRDLCSRGQGRIQVTTDGFPPYIEAMERAFGMDADYAQLMKVYEVGEPGMGRYNPPHVTEVVIRTIAGAPDPERRGRTYESAVEPRRIGEVLNGLREPQKMRLS
jgi:hypothetical protein